MPGAGAREAAAAPVTHPARSPREAGQLQGSTRKMARSRRTNSSSSRCRGSNKDEATSRVALMRAGRTPVPQWLGPLLVCRQRSAAGRGGRRGGQLGCQPPKPPAALGQATTMEIQGALVRRTEMAMVLALTVAQGVAVTQAAATGQSGGGSPAGRSGSRTSRRTD